MKDEFKVLKIVALILLVILLCIAAFGGLYTKANNVWHRMSSKFNYGMELGDVRQITFEYCLGEEEKEVYVDENGNYKGDVVKSNPTQEISLETTDQTSTEKAESNDDVKYNTEKRLIKDNDDSLKNIETFEKAKKIIKKRIASIGNSIDYDIRIDNETGNLVIETINDDEIVGSIEQAVLTKGDFKVIDEQTGVILLDKDDVDYVQANIYQVDESNYQTLLAVAFKGEAKDILKDVSNRYRLITKEDGTTETKYISVLVDNSKISTTYFGEELTSGVLQIPLGQKGKTALELKETYEAAVDLADLINRETLPIAYDLSQDILYKNNVTDAQRIIAMICFAVLVLGASIFLTIKFKKHGLVMSIINIGFIAASLIAIRYFSRDIPITLNSLIAFVMLEFANLCFIYLYLKDRKDNSIIKELYWETMKDYYLAIIPLVIVAFFFTFATSVSVSSSCIWINSSIYI